MTYKQAYDKIIDAYFKDEIKPFDPKFCFCGTLCNNKTEWFNYVGIGHFPYNGYDGNDFNRMEDALLEKMELGINSYRYEDFLFEGMCKALNVLKNIHLERGEIIDEPIETFKKRELSMQL